LQRNDSSDPGALVVAPVPVSPPRGTGARPVVRELDVGFF
jgi:hypothetical protein